MWLPVPDRAPTPRHPRVRPRPSAKTKAGPPACPGAPLTTIHQPYCATFSVSAAATGAAAAGVAAGTCGATGVDWR